MTNTDKIRVAAKRILGPMEAFRTGAAAPDSAADVIGVYDAPGGAGPVWVTSAGLLVTRGHTLESLHYARMREVRAPDSKEKGSPESYLVRVILDNGTNAVVNIAGGRARFSDSFEFARFLTRASSFARKS